MTLRRYAPLKESRGTVISAQLRLEVLLRDTACVGWQVGFPVTCFGTLQLDHVRASHGTGMKSRTEPDNLVSLCSNCHRWKTEHGKEARPLLLEYLAKFGYGVSR